MCEKEIDVKQTIMRYDPHRTLIYSVWRASFVLYFIFLYALINKEKKKLNEYKNFIKLEKKNWLSMKKNKMIYFFNLNYQYPKFIKV